MIYTSNQLTGLYVSGKLDFNVLNKYNTYINPGVSCSQQPREHLDRTNAPKRVCVQNPLAIQKLHSRLVSGARFKQSHWPHVSGQTSCKI